MCTPAFYFTPSLICKIITKRSASDE